MNSRVTGRSLNSTIYWLNFIQMWCDVSGRNSVVMSRIVPSAGLSHSPTCRPGWRCFQFFFSFSGAGQLMAAAPAVNYTRPPPNWNRCVLFAALVSLGKWVNVRWRLLDSLTCCSHLTLVHLPSWMSAAHGQVRPLYLRSNRGDLFLVFKKINSSFGQQIRGVV